MELDNIFSLYQILFWKANDDWLKATGKPNAQLFWNDDLRLSKTGYQKFATSLFNFISSCNTSKSTSFDIRKIVKSFLYCWKPTSTFQPRRTSIFLKDKSFAGLSIFINHLYTVCIFVKFLYLYLLLAFLLLVLPFLFQPINKF